jgi:hypothetical protein
MKKIADWPEEKRCRDREHDPPTMIVLEPGIYEHECPRCGKKQRVVIPPKPSLRSRLQSSNEEWPSVRR